MGKSSMVIFHQPENNVNSLKCSLAGALETKNYLYCKSDLQIRETEMLSSVAARTFTLRSAVSSDESLKSFPKRSHCEF